MTEWEYKTVGVSCEGLTGEIVDNRKLDKALNRMGRNGWELVSTLDTGQRLGQEHQLLCTFKRQRARRGGGSSETETV